MDMSICAPDPLVHDVRGSGAHDREINWEEPDPDGTIEKQEADDANDLGEYESGHDTPGEAEQGHDDCPHPDPLPFGTPSRLTRPVHPVSGVDQLWTSPLVACAVPRPEYG
jgi:hypothetical protein